MNTSLPTSVYQNEITDSSAWKSEDLSPSQSWNVSLTEEQQTTAINIPISYNYQLMWEIQNSSMDCFRNQGGGAKNKIDQKSQN